MGCQPVAVTGARPAEKKLTGVSRRHGVLAKPSGRITIKFLQRLPAAVSRLDVPFDCFQAGCER